MLAPPPPDPDARPHRLAAREGRLALPRCRGCGLLVWYPRARCPRCHGEDLAWETVSGRGVVYAFTVVHRPAHPSLAEAVPYVVALVDLVEGARMMTNVVDCPVEDVRIGMPVAVRFRAVDDGTTLLPVFGPAPPTPAPEPGA